MAETKSSKMSLAGLKAWQTIRKRRGLPEPPPKVKPKLVKRERIRLPKGAGWASPSDVKLRTVVLVLTTSKIGNTRKVDTTDVFAVRQNPENNKKNQEWFNATKKLMDSEELTEISSIFGECDRFIKRRALPMTIKAGVHALPVAFIEECDAKFVETEQKIKPLVERLISRRTALINEAKARLSRVKVGNEYKNFFDIDDYPTAEEIRGAIGIRYRYVKIDSAENVQTVSREIYQKELKKAETQWQEDREAITQMFRAQFKAMLEHAIERLKPNDEGRTKTFHDFDRFVEFCSTFENRNVYGDNHMSSLVKEAKDILAVTNAEGLRSDTEVRDYVRKAFEDVKNVVDTMVKPERTRAIRLVD